LPTKKKEPYRDCGCKLKISVRREFACSIKERKKERKKEKERRASKSVFVRWQLFAKD